MLSLNGREADVDTFAFFLARELGKTVGELQDMPTSEYVGWQAYYEATGAMRDVKVRHGNRG